MPGFAKSPSSKCEERVNLSGMVSACLAYIVGNSDGKYFLGLLPSENRPGGGREAGGEFRQR